MLILLQAALVFVPNYCTKISRHLYIVSVWQEVELPSADAFLLLVMSWLILLFL